MIETSGRTTRTSVLWLAQADLEAFSDALRASMPGLAWHCSHWAMSGGSRACTAG